MEAAPQLVRATYLATRQEDHAKTVASYLREMFIGAQAERQRYGLSDAELARIQQPLLLIWGQGDDRSQPIAEAKRRATLMPDARFEVLPGGHEPWLDDVA